MTTSEMVSKMEALLQQLAKQTEPRIKTDGPVSATLDIIQKLELNPSQRLIVLYLLFNASREPIHQRELCDNLGLVMKTVRTNVRELYKLGYVHPGTKSYTWEING
jgi:DNA-binding MarR family transcriptional regulator